MRMMVAASTMIAAVVLPHAVAAQTTYTSRAAFTAAAGTISTETFTGCGTSTVSISGSVSSTSGPCTGILAGVTYSAAGTGNLYIAGPGQSANSTTALGIDTPLGNALVITFASNLSAFGVDLFQNQNGGLQSGTAQAFTLNFLLGATSVGSYNYNVASGTGSFFGLTGATFNTVRIAETTGFAVIDNVSFGMTAVAVPEPATWGLMLIGFGAIGYAMRRRSAKVAVAA